MYKKWTKEEEKVLLQYVKKYDTHLKTAWKKSATKLGRTPLSCENHWYWINKQNQSNKWEKENGLKGMLISFIKKLKSILTA